MGWLFRKSIRILPGVRLNLSRKRASVSVGPPGVKYNIGPGTRRLTVGIPGTGLYHTQKLGQTNPSQRQPAASTAAPSGRGPVFWVVLVFGLVVAGLFLYAAGRSPTDTPKARFGPTVDSETPAAPAGKSKDQQSVTRIIGRARVVDGDTIIVNGVQIRLEGIDAPETEQACTGAKGDRWSCGVTATQRLAGLIKGEVVSCTKTGTDRYARVLAICSLKDGTELNAWLVREGLAVAFVRYSMRYVTAEREAKAARRGLWAGSFDLPWDWRAANRQPVTAPLRLFQQSPQLATKNSACTIKGNINSSGERIYHVPGSKWYDRTQINERNGERWFCSVAEAEAAGWRGPRGRN
jgi:endonuclease YncB( thermonuclease family)